MGTISSFCLWGGEHFWTDIICGYETEDLQGEQEILGNTYDAYLHSFKYFSLHGKATQFSDPFLCAILTSTDFSYVKFAYGRQEFCTIIKSVTVNI